MSGGYKSQNLKRQAAAHERRKTNFQYAERQKEGYIMSNNFFEKEMSIAVELIDGMTSAAEYNRDVKNVYFTLNHDKEKKTVEINFTLSAKTSHEDFSESFFYDMMYTLDEYFSIDHKTEEVTCTERTNFKAVAKTVYENSGVFAKIDYSADVFFPEGIYEHVEINVNFSISELPDNYDELVAAYLDTLEN